MLRPTVRNLPDLNQVSEGLWNRARERYAAIQPLLVGKQLSKEAAQECDRAAGIHVSTLYRWLAAYRTAGRAGIFTVCDVHDFCLHNQCPRCRGLVRLE